MIGDCDEILRLAPQGEIRAAADGPRSAALALIRRSLPGAQSNTPASAAAAPPTPDQTSTPPALAECMNKAGNDVARKIAACSRAIETNPGNDRVVLPARLQRAILYQQIKQWDRVIADCDEILRLAPEGEMKSAAGILRNVARGSQTNGPA
ncbi:MAG: hypothetical protein J2P53_12760, partial [Bradyrhizobiaceae bacterium]|nr:hypothetical protein [Bradyrhizobiaceae bacterium]